MDSKFISDRDNLVKNFVINTNNYKNLIGDNDKELTTYEDCIARYELVKTTYTDFVKNLKIFDDNYVILYNQLLTKQKNSGISFLDNWTIPVDSKITTQINSIPNKQFLLPPQFKYNREKVKSGNAESERVASIELETHSQILILPEINCKICDKKFKCDLGDCAVIEEEYNKCIEPYTSEQNKKKTMGFLSIAGSLCCCSIIIIIIIIVIIKNRQ
jgi:hypothetical protein